jgi:tRNA A-37 threonylcarbamoyl transferase component Bud32
MRAREQWLRCYALAIGVGTVILIPLAARDLGTKRVHPIDVSRAVVRGSTLLAGTHVVAAVRIGDGAWHPAASIAVARRVRNLPVGTTVHYRTSAGVVSGMVRTAPRPPTEAIARLVLILVGLAFAAGGIILAVSGAETAAFLAAGALAGFAGLLGGPLLEPSVVRVASVGLRDALISTFVLLPRPLALALLAGFLASFPTRLHLRRAERVLLLATITGGIIWCVLSFLCQLPIVEQFSASVQHAILFPFRYSLIQLLTYLPGAVLAVVLAVRQWRVLRGPHLSRERLRRGRLAVLAVILGIIPSTTFAVLQSLALLLLGQRVIPGALLSVSFLCLMLVPLGLSYAILARRVESFGLLVHRAVLFLIAARTIRILALLPLLVLTILVFEHRHKTIASVMTTNPVGTFLAIGMSLLGLWYGRACHDLLERVLCRDRHTARVALHALVARVGEATDVPSLSRLLATEVERALNLESVSCFWQVRNGFTDGTITILRTSPLAALVAAAPSLVDLHAEESVTLFGEEDWDWLNARHVAQLVPLRASTRTLVGILALGEQRSEQPFDQDDHHALRLLAAATGLALENHLLRATPAPRVETEEVARYCTTCHTVFNSDAALCLTDRTPLAPADVPAVLNGTYRLEEHLGAGAMGVVYRARDLTLGRTVALKTLPRVSAHAAARLRREARTVAGLAHPHVATIFAAEQWGDRPILVFEFLPGGTLDRRLHVAPVSLSEFFALAIGLGSALAAAHAAGLLHRDVKPSNVGYDAAGRPKLLDFGLARFETEPSHGLSGTPAYLSPETILGAPPNAAADLWALSLTLYEALTRRNPFCGENPTATMNRILVGNVSDPREFRPECPAGLAALLLLCLSPDPARRPGRTFLAALAEVRHLSA